MAHQPPEIKEVTHCAIYFSLHYLLSFFEIKLPMLLIFQVSPSFIFVPNNLSFVSLHSFHTFKFNLPTLSLNLAYFFTHSYLNKLMSLFMGTGPCKSRFALLGYQGYLSYMTPSFSRNVVEGGHVAQIALISCFWNNNERCS